MGEVCVPLLIYFHLFDNGSAASIRLRQTFKMTLQMAYHLLLTKTGWVKRVVEAVKLEFRESIQCFAAILARGSGERGVLDNFLRGGKR